MKGYLNCQCGCGFKISSKVVEILESIEKEIGEITVNSGARCAKHNDAIGGKSNSAHILGMAADVSTPSPTVRYNVLKSLFLRDIKRIGWSREKKFIHFDIATGTVPVPSSFMKEYPQLVAWDY